MYLCKVDIDTDFENETTFLSIIKKENSELVNSNLFAYLIENDWQYLFWRALVKKIFNKKIYLNWKPKVFREYQNVDLLIEVHDKKGRVKHVIVIENKNHMNKQKNKFTPDNITSLQPNEIFVFGSNLEGMHGGGAAKVALDKFGAVWGQGVGLQGQSYGIPTMHGGVEVIAPYVDEFIEFAANHTEMFFYVTRIGCGIAGFRDEQIAPLFTRAIDLDNVALPKSFVNIIEKNK